MLRVSKMADYGVALMVSVARNGQGGVHTARTMAEATSLPHPTVTKILKTLARASLLESHRGVSGGYSLTRVPAEISLVEIINALDGPPGLTQCTDRAAGPCAREDFCETHISWLTINQAVVETLAKVTLADLARASPTRSQDMAGGAR